MLKAKNKVSCRRLYYRRNNADGRLQSALCRYFLLQFTDIAKREGYPFPA